MTKKKYMIIIWTITLICILVGLASNVGGFIPVFASVKTKKDDISYGRQKITGIVVDMDAADLNITNGSELKIGYTYPESSKPQIEFKNGVLNIANHSKENNYKSLKKACTLDITVPDDNELTDMDVRVSYGDVDISSLKSKKVNLSVACGDVDVDSVISEDGRYALNKGDLDITNCVQNNLVVECDMGDVDIDGDFDSIDANCNLGDIDIYTKKAANEVKIKANCNLGDVTVNDEKW